MVFSLVIGVLHLVLHSLENQKKEQKSRKPNML